MVHAGTSSISSVGREMVERLTAALGIQFTLTDSVGAVLVSTGGHPRGHVDPAAAIVLREGKALEYTGVLADEDDATVELHSPAAGPAGLLAAEPGVYLPVRADGLGDGPIEGVLIAHGPPDQVRVVASSAVAALGVAADFSRAASISVRQAPRPAIAMNQLLRGSPRAARRAAVVARVIGWNLSIPRVVVVILRPGQPLAEQLAAGAEEYAMITEFVETVAPGTPVGQIDPAEWVLLPELPLQKRRPAPRQLAEDVRAALLEVGSQPAIGLGEAHAEPSLPALRRSYREARFAARCGPLLHDNPDHTDVFQLSDLGPAAFLAPDPVTRRRLARRIVQPLQAEAEIRKTARMFLDSNLSLAATARCAGLHRHTIRSHLRRVHELTGLDPRALDDALQLRMALLLQHDP